MAGSEQVEGANQVEAFTLEFRAWLEANLPDDLRSEAGGTTLELVMEVGIERLRSWNHCLADARFAAIAWPAEFGGRDAGPLHQVAYLEELSRAGAPGPLNLVGIPNIGPAIMAWATDEQRTRFLPGMLRGDELWCQGFSEPGAGSDLASLETRARLDGDHYVVSGQKVWTSLGHLADFCELLVRTDPHAPARSAMSCLLVDLRLPGIERRPLRTMSGATEFAEMFFDDVRVPRSALLGPEGRGWEVAMSTLTHERAGFAMLHLRARSKLQALTAESAPTADTDLGFARHGLRRQELADLYIRLRVLELFGRRVLAESASGLSSPKANLAKLLWSDLENRIASAAGRLLGPAAMAGQWAEYALRTPGYRIAGGTSEVVRNTLAERVLMLPR
ncbi:MAG TPA: acyl-CoA dehydrogenase family protein [Ilumatobacter sp.]|nr:acyl-CoA dehydrogenase family protein [Ilumatobacter sp.]